MKLTRKQRRALERLPLPVSDWKKIHFNTRRSLCRRNLVTQDMFGNVWAEKYLRE